MMRGTFVYLAKRSR